MQFSISSLGRLALAGVLAVQILGNPIGPVSSPESSLAIRGFTPPKIPKPPGGGSHEPPVGGGSRGDGPLTGGSIAPKPGEGSGKGDGGPLTGGEISGGSAGQSGWTNRIDHAIKDNTPDTVVKDLRPTYAVIERADQPAEFKEPAVLNPSGDAPVKFDNPDSLRYKTYQIQNDEFDSDWSAILRAQTEKDKGIFSVGYVYKSNDELPNEADKIFPSDMMYQVWKEASGSPAGGTLADLKVHVQANINNPDTVNLIKAVHQDKGIGMEKGASGSWIAGTPEFDQFLSSQNASPFARMLTDHHQAFGDKRITSIRTISQGTGPEDLPCMAIYTV